MKFTKSKFCFNSNVIKRLTAVVALSGLALAQTAEAVNLIVIGDSITRGIDRNQSFRRMIWLMLQQDQIKDVNFIGKFNGTFNEKENNSDWDADHMAIWGGTAANMAGELEPWLKLDATKNRPDIALINMGTNDLRGNNSAQKSVDNVFRLITIMRAANPKLQVIATQITPWNPDKGGANGWIGFNQEILRFSKDSTAESPIVVVDQFTDFVVKDDHADGIHPNAKGCQKMTNKYYPVLKKMVPGTLQPTQILISKSNRTTTMPTLLAARNRVQIRYEIQSLGMRSFSLLGKVNYP